MEASFKFDIFADYFQFLLMDESSQDACTAVWSDEAVERMLVAGSTSVSLGTLRNVTVPVSVNISIAEPTVNLERFDHAVSASLSVPSGQLVVMGCTGYLPEAPRIKVPAGTYQLLYLASGLGSITYESDPADDQYCVYLWPGSSHEPALLKHWRASA
jgi:hypothetical protein